MDLYLTAPVAPFGTLAPVAYASFTTKRDISPLPVPQIPAGVLRPGSVIKIEAEGEYSTTGTPTANWGLYLGTHDGLTTSTPAVVTDIALSSTITTPSASAAFPWRLEWRGRVTKIGSAGSMVGNGTLEQGITLTTQSSFPVPITAALRTVVINTVQANAVGVSFTWGTSSPSNTVTTYNLSVLILN